MYVKINSDKFQGFDLTKYRDRVLYNLCVFNPVNLFVTDNEVQQARDYLAKYQKEHPDAMKPNTVIKSRDYWNAQIVMSSTIHPDTKEPVLLPFRMASCVPTNLFFTTLLLLPNPSTSMIIFSNLGNQTVNVGFNLANANKSTAMTASDTAMAYTAAVGSSIGVAYGLNELLKRSKRLTPAMRSVAGVCIPVTASSLAGIANVVMTRYKELVTGINIYDEEGNLCDGPKSFKAANKALTQVSITRVLTALPTLATPPLLWHLLQKSNYIRTSPRLKLPITIGLISSTLFLALPFSIAAYPQRYPIASSKLEPEYAKKYPGQTLYYNKGL